ncbi:cytochrome c1 [Sphingomonas sp. DT-204]|uniref:cytochrome c1 n=1 Tax=Sphingomonas sp. DT-204 TaxID=3396166 RepID=UPI003F1A2763
MVRIIGGIIGLGFALVLAIALVGSISGLITEPPQPTAETVFHEHPKELKLASDGPFGGYSKNTRQLQRGFQVYKEVCAACHSIRLVAFRDLEGIGYNEAQVKAIAAQWATPQPSVNPETGEPATRPNTPADKFPLAFANDVAARAANNNAIPPDLSLMTKARHDGAAYIHSLLTGYQEQPADLLKRFPEAKTPNGLHYNPYFANLNLAMPPPLTTDGQVTYQDGTKATVDQMAQDVAAFLVWTAEPKLEARHIAGWAAVVFIAIFCFLAYGAYLSVWRGVKH